MTLQVLTPFKLSLLSVGARLPLDSGLTGKTLPSPRGFHIQRTNESPTLDILQSNAVNLSIRCILDAIKLRKYTAGSIHTIRCYLTDFLFVRRCRKTVRVCSTVIHDMPLCLPLRTTLLPTSTIVWVFLHRSKLSPLRFRNLLIQVRINYSDPLLPTHYALPLHESNGSGGRLCPGDLHVMSVTR